MHQRPVRRPIISWFLTIPNFLAFYHDNVMDWTESCELTFAQIVLDKSSFGWYTINNFLYTLPIYTWFWFRLWSLHSTDRWKFDVSLFKWINLKSETVWLFSFVFVEIFGCSGIYLQIDGHFQCTGNFIAPKSISSQIVGLRQKLHKTHLCNRLYWLILTRCWISLELNYPWIMNLWTALHRISINAKWNESDLVYR